jgi:hypothetical protein
VSNARLFAAMEEASRSQPIRLPLEWYFPTSLRAVPPVPVSAAVELPESQGLPAAVVAPVAVQRLPDAPGEVRPAWQALLDISVWRSRWLWRLAASLVVKRLSR